MDVSKSVYDLSEEHSKCELITLQEKHVEAPGQPDGTLSPAGSTEQEDVNKQDKNQGEY